MKNEFQIKKSEEKLKKEFIDAKQKKSENIKKSIEAIELKIKNLEVQKLKLIQSLQNNEIREFVSPIPSYDERLEQSKRSLQDKAFDELLQEDTLSSSSSERIKDSSVFS